MRRPKHGRRSSRERRLEAKQNPTSESHLIESAPSAYNSTVEHEIMRAFLLAPSPECPITSSRTSNLSRGGRLAMMCALLAPSLTGCSVFHWSEVDTGLADTGTLPNSGSDADSDAMAAEEDASDASVVFEDAT